MSDQGTRGFDFAQKGFSALFMVSVVEIKQSSDHALVTFRMAPAGVEEYFKPGDSFAAKFDPIAEDDDGKKPKPGN